MVLQAEQLSMRATALTIPTRRVMMPLMANSTIISHLQQMCHVVDEVQDLAEWMDVVEQVIHDEVTLLEDIPDPDP